MYNKIVHTELNELLKWREQMRNKLNFIQKNKNKNVNVYCFYDEYIFSYFLRKKKKKENSSIIFIFKNI